VIGPHLHRSFLDVARRLGAALYHHASGGRVWYQTPRGWASRPPPLQDIHEMRDKHLEPCKWRARC
jgi:hypothetical protein